MKPLGVDVPQKQKHGLGGSMITVIVLSSVTGFVICIGVAWVLVLKCRGHVHQAEDIPHSLISSFAKPSGDTFAVKFSKFFTKSLIVYKLLLSAGNMICINSPEYVEYHYYFFLDKFPNHPE